ncbi:MAG: phospholipase [Bacteroidota bacterium]
MKYLLWFPFAFSLTLAGCLGERAEVNLHNSNLAAADYWSDEAKILSAGVGFADIIEVDFDELTKENALAAGAAWLDDLNCDAGGAAPSQMTLAPTVDIFYRGDVDYSVLKEGALGLDGQPIVFSWPLLSAEVHPEDFQITLNTGEVVFPQFAGMVPNFEYNERNCVVLFGEVCNRLASSNPDARFPVRVDIVDDGTPLKLIGPDQEIVSAVGMFWETTTSPYDENNGPRLVGAKLNYCGSKAAGEGIAGVAWARQLVPNDEFALYGGGDFRLRMLTTGGFSPDGVRGVKPTDFEKHFIIHALGENGDTVLIDKVGQDFSVLGGNLKVIGLSDLGLAQDSYDDCYIEDRDNYIDIILVGDEAAARNITFLEIPSLEGGYTPFYNPGGPGTTPTPGVSYSAAGPRDLEPVIIALDDPMRVSYDAYRYQ